MGQLPRKNVPHLLTTVNGSAKSPSKPLPEVDSQASPLHSSASDSEVDATEAQDQPSPKRIKLSSPDEKNVNTARSQSSSPAQRKSRQSSSTPARRTNTRKGKSPSKAAAKSADVASPLHKVEQKAPSAPLSSPVKDDQLEAFDEMWSSNQSGKRNIKQYRARASQSTLNVHAKSAQKGKKGKKAEVAEEPEKAMFKIPEEVTSSLPSKYSVMIKPQHETADRLLTILEDEEAKTFAAPLKPLDTRHTRSKKPEFVVPEGIQSSAPTPNREFKSKDLVGTLSSQDTAAAASELDSSELSSPESLESSPVPPHMGSNTAVCPMCKAEVDKELLEQFSGGKKLRLKAAMDFCIAHKQQNAKSNWSDSKWPAVDWKRFNKRLKQHNPRLKSILKNERPSVFREQLAAKVASGQTRNALRNPEADGQEGLNAVTGYYGSKGARKMMEHITNKFASKIRKLAPKEHLFTEIGVAGYIQAVLVSELAVALVVEDYDGCDEARAREILTESAEVGNLVHAEEDEQIEQKDEDAPLTDMLPADSPPHRKSKKKRRQETNA